jgi:hypothetical protein
MVLAAATLAALLVLVLLPAGASAQGCDAPPGTAATEQYCEQLLPNASGGVGGDTASSPDEGAGGTDTLADVLPDDVVKELEASGPDAQALLRLPATQTDEGGRPFDPKAGGLGEEDLTPQPGKSGGGLWEGVTKATKTVSSGLVWLLGTMLVGLGAATLLSYLGIRRPRRP